MLCSALKEGVDGRVRRDHDVGADYSTRMIGWRNVTHRFILFFQW
jgi:hypothetical protein